MKQISDELLAELTEKITPIVVKNGVFMRAGQCDHRECSFVWMTPLDPIDMSQFEVLAVIETYHEYGYPALFKPSVAEVLAQIPAKYRSEVSAFLIGDARISSNTEQTHSATTTLYRRAKSNEVACEESPEASR